MALKQEEGCRVMVPKSKTVIIFRYDDYHADREGIDATKSQIEYRILDIFTKYKVPLTIGIVPNVTKKEYWETGDTGFLLLSEDKQKFDALRIGIENNIVEAALHGFTHQIVEIDGKISEFKGLDYPEQFRKIAQGRQLLEKWFNIQVATFIPPCNRCDSLTIKALEENNFVVLSNALYGPVVNSTVKYLPTVSSLPWIYESLRLAEKAVGGTKFIVCMFHHYDLVESRSPNPCKMSLESLEKTVSDCAQNPNIELMTLGKAATTYSSDLDSEQYAEAVKYFQQSYPYRGKKFWGRVVEHYFPDVVYYPKSYYLRKNKILKWISTAAQWWP
ncbi:MAG: DUF2334 domain-containing protein [bacterium]|nr:DUF2334 domain-containing protein [bacterium]